MANASYWVLFLAPAWAALNATLRRAGAARRERWPTAWRWAFIALALMIGFRDQVGGDWGSFLLYSDENGATGLLADPLNV